MGAACPAAPSIVPRSGIEVDSDGNRFETFVVLLSLVCLTRACLVPMGGDEIVLCHVCYIVFVFVCVRSLWKGIPSVCVGV